MNSRTPPLLAERLLAALVRDREWRDSIVGDLRQEFAEVTVADGPRAARRWYWRQALAIGGRAVAARVGAARPPRASWLAAADADAPAAGRLTGFTRDLRHAMRALGRRPGTSAVIVGTLALTLATNSAIFAIVDAIVLRPFRFPAVDRVAVLMSSEPQDPVPDRESVAAADFQEWRAEARTLRYLSAAEWWDANLSGLDTPEQVAGYRVTADFFHALEVTPMLGRGFVAAEEAPGQHRRAVLGYRLWERRFAADPAIVGRTIRLDGEPYEVVGVAPRSFAIPDGAEVWAPIAYTAEQWKERRRGYLRVFSQLAVGASFEQARAEMTSLVERQRRDYPDTNRSRPVRVEDFVSGMADPGTGAFMMTVQAASLLLMLIACANIANLLLARGSERAQEYSVRLALGASRGRLAWQTLFEGAVLSLFAVVLAVPLAWAAIGLSRAGVPASVIRFIPGFEFIRISPSLFVAMAATGAVATLVFSLLPALNAGRVNVSQSLRVGSRTLTTSRQRHWLRSALATAQVALTLALLFASGMTLAGADRAVNGVFGFDKRNLIVAGVILPDRPYADPAKRRVFMNTVLDRLQAIPAITAAGVVNTLPYGGGNTMRDFYRDGEVLTPQTVRQVDFRRASNGYLAAMRIPLVAGRVFNEDDRSDSQAVALVSQKVVERYWPTVDPLGRRFKLTPDGQWITVVGVVGDVLDDWFQQRRSPTVYRPVTQDAPLAQIFVARTIGDPNGIAGDIRRAVALADPDQPITLLMSMAQFIEDRTSGITFVARALGVVAFIALVLAISGLYSLMAFIASLRRQEIGVRMALGAGWWQVIRLATSQAIRIIVIGIIIGAVLAAGLGRAMESILLGMVSINWLHLASLTAGLVAVALLSAYLPARRAAGLNPTIALRAD